MLDPARAVESAKDMTRTFKSLQLGLMVGIGGGVPGPSGQKLDVRLGDVVVNTAGSGTSGVFHLDFGKSPQAKPFIHTGSLDKPFRLLLSAIPKLKANLRRRNGFAEEL